MGELPSELPRRLEEPITRAEVVAYYRAGLTTTDICTLLSISDGSLRREWGYDPDFYADCIKAMEDPFEPTLAKALELSLKADAAGENEGAHKAMAQVLRFYERVLDRKSKLEVGLRAADKALGTPSQGRGSLVIGAEGVKELVDQLRISKQRQEATEIEETHES